MYDSVVLKVVISKPYAEVYEYLVDPKNLVEWATTPEGDVVPADDGTWLLDVPEGRMKVRVTPRNDFGVLDYEIFPAHKAFGMPTPVRLYPNDHGCELTLTRFRRPDVPEETFRSDTEWLATDLEVLRTVLEER